MVTIPDKQPYIEDIPTSWYDEKISRLSMLRLDVLHPTISGNKWFKLKENISSCKKQGRDTVLTFGGGYSNHLSATAAAAGAFSLNSIGVVRGVYKNMTPTLEYCKSMGMHLHFISQIEYKKKTETGFLAELAALFSSPYIIPEGGANQDGRVGAEAIANYITNEYSHIALSVGTGTTLVGVTNATKANVIGYAPLKGGAYLEEELLPFINTKRQKDFTIKGDWHFGGFGKCNDKLISFMNDFYFDTGIPLDRVYTAKMMYGIKHELLNNIYDRNTKLLCIHTGGLQGNSSIRERLKY